MKNINVKNINVKSKNVKNINVKSKNVKNKKKWDLELLEKKNHTKYINMLYLDQSFSNEKIIKKALKMKLSSYRQQDTKKNLRLCTHIVQLNFSIMEKYTH